MNSIHPEDIVERIYYNTNRWNPLPRITLNGDEGTFGELIFDFYFEPDARTGNTHKVMKYKIYIKNKQHIVNCCEMAILNYDILTEKIRL